jgi:hypothetical protein
MYHPILNRIDISRTHTILYERLFTSSTINRIIMWKPGQIITIKGGRRFRIGKGDCARCPQFNVPASMEPCRTCIMNRIGIFKYITLTEICGRTTKK